MEVYAAMVDNMDQGIGRIVKTLKKNDELDNTLILFLQDNGGCAEFMAEDGWAQSYPDFTNGGEKIVKGNIENLRPGDPLTFQSYDRPWANASNAPFRLYKHYVHEGGISTPLIAHWPNRFKKPHTCHSASHVVDILPTILEASGSQYLSEIGGHETQPLQGESLMHLLDGKSWQREQPIFWEHEGNSAIRLGQFKLVRQHNHDWELYDMETDRTELNNLIGKNARLETELLKQYQAWANSSGVVDWNRLLPGLLKAWGLNDVDG